MKHTNNQPATAFHTIRNDYLMMVLEQLAHAVHCDRTRVCTLCARSYSAFAVYKCKYTHTQTHSTHTRIRDKRRSITKVSQSVSISEFSIGSAVRPTTPPCIVRARVPPVIECVCKRACVCAVYLFPCRLTSRLRVAHAECV